MFEAGTDIAEDWVKCGNADAKSSEEFRILMAIMNSFLSNFKLLA
jgi:hypothetical protein